MINPREALWLNRDVAVIGAGPAGMLAAGIAAERGLSVAVLEKNEKVGRKLMITGKGRCNVTNACSDISELISNVPVNGRFMFGAFSRFMPYDVMDFFEERGVPLKIERGNRVFPVSDKAVDIVDAMRAFVLKSGAEILNFTVTDVRKNPDGVFEIKGEGCESVFAKNVIIASGGKSYPQTGSTGDGYAFAESFGHTISPLKPSLVPLTVHEGWCSALQGLSLRNVAVSVYDNFKFRKIYEDFGEMLFTHFGVSGPVILSASSHMREMEKGRYSIHIDLKPALNEKQLDARVLRDFAENSNKNFINALGALLPNKLIPVAVKLSGIEPSTKVNHITKQQRSDFVALLKDLTLTVTDFRPIKEAIITSGGVNVKEIDPKTMQSKLTEGLYFAGEVIDVDAYTGGFNLQIAFSTGFLAGKSVSSR